MPAVTILDLSQPEQATLLAALRQARFGYLLAVHVLLLCAAGKTPTEIADCLFCSRSSVYRIVAAHRAGTLGFGLEADGRLGPPIRTTALLPWLRRALPPLLKRSPRAFGWCRTRWSCALLAAELETRHGVEVSAETPRRWIHEVGWVWKRAKLAGRDDDPERVAKLARIRYAFENLGGEQSWVFADELDIALIPKVGYEWTPKGEQVVIPTPGSNQKNYLVGALELRTGRITRCVWWRKQAGLFLDLLKLLDRTYRVGPYARIYVVIDNAKIHKAGVVMGWLAEHPRFVLLYLPTS